MYALFFPAWEIIGFGVCLFFVGWAFHAQKLSSLIPTERGVPSGTQVPGMKTFKSRIFPSACNLAAKEQVFSLQCQRCNTTANTGLITIISVLF